jgi:hypothetical protein
VFLRLAEGPVSGARRAAPRPGMSVG